MPYGTILKPDNLSHYTPRFLFTTCKQQLEALLPTLNKEVLVALICNAPTPEHFGWILDIVVATPPQDESTRNYILTEVASRISNQYGLFTIRHALSAGNGSWDPWVRLLIQYGINSPSLRLWLNSLVIEDVHPHLAKFITDEDMAPLLEGLFTAPIYLERYSQKIQWMMILFEGAASTINTMLTNNLPKECAGICMEYMPQETFTHLLYKALATHLQPSQAFHIQPSYRDFQEVSNALRLLIKTAPTTPIQLTKYITHILNPLLQNSTIDWATYPRVVPVSLLACAAALQHSALYVELRLQGKQHLPADIYFMTITLAASSALDRKYLTHFIEDMRAAGLPKAVRSCFDRHPSLEHNLLAAFISASPKLQNSRYWQELLATNSLLTLDHLINHLRGLHKTPWYCFWSAHYSGKNTASLFDAGFIKEMENNTLAKNRALLIQKIFCTVQMADVWKNFDYATNKSTIERALPTLQDLRKKHAFVNWGHNPNTCFNKTTLAQHLSTVRRDAPEKYDMIAKALTQTSFENALASHRGFFAFGKTTSTKLYNATKVSPASGQRP